MSDIIPNPETRIALFQHKEIRRTIHNHEWWFVITDVVAALTDSPDPSDYLKKIRKRDLMLADAFKGGGQLVPPLAFEFSTAGGPQKCYCWNTEGLFRLIQSIPSPKAEPFKRWLARVGYERIQEIEDPELATKRTRALYKAKGYSDDWIEKRMRSIAIRDELTDEWKKRGVKEQREYAILTAEISQATFGLTPSEYAEFKRLKRENLRDHMNDLELIFSMLGEAATTEITRTRDAQGILSTYCPFVSQMRIPIHQALWFLWIWLAWTTAAAEMIHEVKETSGHAVQLAIDACATNGGGVVYLPPGRYVSGPLWLKDNVELRLEAGATVVLSPDKADWPTGTRALINAKGAKHIAITGRGTFDGNAQWEYAPVRGQDPEIAEEQEIARRAGVEMKRYYRKGDVQKYLFVLQDSEDVRFEGVTIRNAPLWNVRLQDCNRVWIRGIFLYSDLERGVNSDGIDIVSSSNVLIAESIITTADDAICLKTVGFGQRGDGAIRPVENVVVNNCILSSSSTAMMIGTETHADIRHVLFSNIVVRNSNKVFGINVQDGATVSDVRFVNVTFDTNRRHWNWWGSAEVMKFVLKKRTPESRLGRIRDITIDGAQGTARGTSLVAGQVERRLENLTVANLRVKMLAENLPDKRATDALVFQAIDGLTLRSVEVDWDREKPEPKWGSALVLRDVSRLILQDFRGQAARPDGPLPAILKQNVTERHVDP